MQRITIISCIIAAVCVFQTAEAGVFDKLGLEKQISNQLGNQNPIEACKKAYTEGLRTIKEVKTIVDTCLSDKINPDNINIQGLSDALDELKATITKINKEALKCLKNPFNAKSCMINVHQENDEGLNSSLKKVKDAATEVMDITSENMSECQKTLTDEISQKYPSVVENFQQCVNSIEKLRPF